MASDSIWLHDNKESYPQFKGKVETDVLIIGGGIAGLTTAYYLSKAGLDTVVVEASEIGRGTTGHTTAHITSQHDCTYERWITRFGHDTAVLIAKANEEAIHEMNRICQTEKIDCDFCWQDSYLFTNSKSGISKLEKETAAAINVGINAQFLTGIDAPFPGIAACVFYKQAQFNPTKYINGLARALTENKCRIYEQSRVLHLEEGRAYTSEGYIIANHIVVATHNPILNFPGMYFAKMYQHRSYCMAFENTPKIEGMWNCIDSNGHTFRAYKDLTIVCGEDHKCGTQKHIRHYEKLNSFAKSCFAEAENRYQWSAQDGITLDNLPYIGKYSKDSKGLYVATGFGKWGMTQSNIAGRVLSDEILDIKNPYAKIYSPQRKAIPISYWNGFYTNASTAAHLIGGLFRFGKPLCAHMKCRLKWNPDEESWDCPCHGSRFEENGSVIDSPAIHDLKRRYRK